MLATYFTSKTKREFHQLLIKENGEAKKVFTYGFAVFNSLLGFILKLFLIRTIHYPEGGLLISLGMVITSAWYGGIGPGLVTVFLDYFIADWFLITPGQLFFSDSPSVKIRFILFLTEGIFISWLFESLHRAHYKTKESLFVITQNEKLLRSLIENIVDHAIFLVDAKGNIQTWNEGATKITGYQSNEILHKPLFFLFPKRGQGKSAILKELRVASAEGRYKQEKWSTRKDKSLFWAETVITALTDSSDDQNFSVIIHDITVRKRADELKNEFFSKIIHELRTPVAIMKVIIENMLAHFSGTKQLGKEISDMLDLQGEVDRLTLLIENILDITRLRTKKFILHFQYIELPLLIRKVAEKMQLVAGQNVFISFHAGHAITVYADEGRIEQVLMNLLDNAIRYTPQGGRIEISAKIVKNMTIVSVLNEAEQEIPEDKYLLIFDKFYQLAKRPMKGLGLGLYISREIIKQHKGEMWVNSGGRKKINFSFSLPLQ